MTVYYTEEFKKIHRSLDGQEGMIAVAESKLKATETFLTFCDTASGLMSTEEWKTQGQLKITSEGITKSAEKIKKMRDFLLNNITKAVGYAVGPDNLLATVKDIEQKEKELRGYEQRLVDANSAISSARSSLQSNPSLSKENPNYDSRDRARAGWNSTISTNQKNIDDVINPAITRLTKHLVDATTKATGLITTIKGLDTYSSTDVANALLVTYPGIGENENFKKFLETGDLSYLDGLSILDAIVENAFIPTIDFDGKGNFYVGEDGKYYFIPTEYKNGEISKIFGNAGINICIDPVSIKKILEKSGDANWQATYNKLINGLNNNSSGIASGAIWNITERYVKVDHNIELIMKQIIEDSYAANNCKTAADYSVVAATVLSSNPVLKLQYSTYFDGTKIDCDGLVIWSNQQANKKLGIDYTTVGSFNQVKEIADGIFSDGLTKSIPVTPSVNFSAGGVLAESSSQAGHAIMVIDEYIASDGTKMIITAQSGGSGMRVQEYSVDYFMKKGYKYCPPENLIKSSTKGTSRA